MLCLGKGNQFIKLFFSVGFLFLFFKFITKETIKPFPNYSNNTKLINKNSFLSIKHVNKILATEKSYIHLLVLALLIGIIISFGSCIYLMVPISLCLLQIQAKKSILNNFILALSYIFGIITIYTILANTATTTTITLIISQWLNNPWLIFSVSLFLIYIAFSLFGLYEINLPSFLAKINIIKVYTPYIYNFLSGIIAGIIAFHYINSDITILSNLTSKIDNSILRFLILFFFSIGIGILLVLIGTISTSILLTQKAWIGTIEIKKIFGFILLGIVIFLIHPFFDGLVSYEGYAILSLITTLYYLIKSNKNKFQFFLLFLFLAITSLLIFWTIKENRSKNDKLLASNLKPDSLIVCLSTAKNQRI